MHLAYIQLGSNIGDRAEQLSKATWHITRLCGFLVQQSALYETAAWGNTEQPNFYNQVILVKTLLTPQELLAQLLQIEQDMGRQRQVKYDPRTIDLDILFYDHLIVDEPNLQIPHPQLPHRRFVLAPLLELAPKKIHPSLKKSITQLWQQCTDELTVTKLS